MTSAQPIRVLIVDDTVIYRKVLGDAIQSIPEAEVVATASSGTLALKRLAQSEVDLVLLDVFMPEMDGVQTLEEIRKQHPSVMVVMVSGATTRDADITVKALQLGALDFIPKPAGENLDDSRRLIAEDLRRVLRLVKLRLISRGTTRLTQELAATKPAAPAVAPPLGTFAAKPSSYELVVIGVSTGGPNALQVLVPCLPADLSVPVLIVQHMPPLFTASLAERLDKASPLSVRESVDGEHLAPGSVLIAPGGRHMTLRSLPNSPNGKTYQIGLNDSPPVNSCRPAVDVLFRSVAAAVNGGILSVILTGMGEDGAAGVATLKRKGCYSIAQDENTCVVYGMPRAVVERGLADEVLPLESIASRIAQLARKKQQQIQTQH